MVISYQDLLTIRNDNKDKKIVLALGSFDLFHYEHLEYLNDAKKNGDILVVGVKDDISVGYKGEGRPIINQDWRIAIIDSLKCVDYTILVNSDFDINIPTKLEDSDWGKEWWYLFYHLFENLNPDILYYENNEKLQLARELMSEIFDIKLIGRTRRALISTTKIINKIKDL